MNVAIAPKTESIAMICPRVPVRSLLVAGVLCLSVAGKVPAGELSGFGHDCCSRVVMPNCQCQNCDCSRRTGKDNVFLKGMRFVIGHFQAMLPSKSVCDESHCDDACDAMMIQELMEIPDAGDLDQTPSASDDPTNGLRQIKVDSIKVDSIKVDSLSGSNGIQPSHVKHVLPDAGEPSDRPSENLPRGSVRLSIPRITDAVSSEQSGTNLIPAPIRDAQLNSASD